MSLKIKLQEASKIFYFNDFTEDEYEKILITLKNKKYNSIS